MSFAASKKNDEQIEEPQNEEQIIEEPLLPSQKFSIIEPSNCKLALDFSDIGYSRYHLASTVCLGLGMLNEGCQIFLIALVNYQVSHGDSKISGGQNVAVIYGSAFFAGNLIGSLLSGFMSDYFGRKRSLILVLVIMYLAGVTQSFLQQRHFWMAVARGISGVGMGCFTPISFTYLAEIMPTKIRGIALTIHASVFTIGGLLAGLVSLAISTKLMKVNFELLNFILAQSAVISLGILAFYLVESPRYSFLVVKNYQNGLKDLREIYRKGKHSSAGNDSGQQNPGNQNSSSNDCEAFEAGRNLLPSSPISELCLQEWIAANQKEKTPNITYLFSSKYLPVTLLSIGSMFCTLFSYYGLIYIAPLVYSGDEEKTMTLVYPYFAEIVSGFLAAFLIERKGFGRKGSLGYGALASALSIAGCGVAVGRSALGFKGGVLVARMVCNFSFIILDAFVSEIYETAVRTTGFAIAISFGKFASAIMPSILEALLAITSSLPFYFLGGLMFITLILATQYPRETIGEQLPES